MSTNFLDKHVLVVGLGESGLAMARWLARSGARLRVADTREHPERLEQLHQIAPTAQFQGGALLENLLDDIDAIFVSPGLSPRNELKPIVEKSHELGMPIWGEVELFAQALAELKVEKNYQPKIIAITGTNGKTTVTSLTGQLCARAGLSVKVAGNISPAMLDVLCECIDEQTLPQVWVLELSSFQLHFNDSFHPDVATILNLTQDHLDWHGDMKQYSADKGKIFGPQTMQVLNRDDSFVMALQRQSAAPQTDVVTFSSDAPEHDGDFGLLSEQGMTWLAVANAQEDEQMHSRKRKKELFDIPVSISRLMPVDALQIRGQHNACNALAALALCRGIGLPLAPLLYGLREYRGEPHRVQHIMTIAGVDYFDDSKGTNVGATVAALKGLGEEHRSGSEDQNKRIILIAGGDGKGQDFSDLALPVASYVKAVFLIGRDADKLQAAIEASVSNLMCCDSLEQAVSKAAEVAQEGDLVLLSPACASMDMFKNYAHRAQIFVDSVRELGLNKGEIC